MLKVNLNSATISRTNTCIKTEMLFKRNQLANYAYSTFLKQIGAYPDYHTQALKYKVKKNAYL